MKAARARIAGLWCRLMHTEPMWPSHGQYQCRTCTQPKSRLRPEIAPLKTRQQMPGRAKTMLRNADHLKGFAIRATDGGLGTVDHFYFDDETWAIRYLTVETGGWLGGRQVLISPISVAQADWQARRWTCALTKDRSKQPRHRHPPARSRQHEAAYLGYYGYPYYWVVPLAGPAFYPAGLAVPMCPSGSDGG